MSAVFSPCGKYRYRLDREFEATGLMFAFFGVNPSKAGATAEDSTTRKWKGFCQRNGGRGYMAGNPFAWCATDVRELAHVSDPVGPDNLRHLAEIIAAADVLVPCWGSRDKIPKHLRYYFPKLQAMLRASGKPVKIFGLTNSGDPKHPLMLGYDTELTLWN